MFTRKVNLENRNEMLKYLENHFTYYTMNPWNAIRGYANNVKIYNLGLEKEVENNLYDLISTECETRDDLYYDIDYLMDDFKEETGYNVFFNGRSSGYIVMDMPLKDDFRRYLNPDLREWVETLKKFDKLCDDILEVCIQYAKSFTTAQKIRDQIEKLDNEIYIKKLEREKLFKELTKAEGE